MTKTIARGFGAALVLSSSVAWAQGAPSVTPPPATLPPPAMQFPTPGAAPAPAPPTAASTAAAPPAPTPVADPAPAPVAGPPPPSGMPPVQPAYAPDGYGSPPPTAWTPPPPAGAPKRSHGFYARAAVLGLGYAHDANYFAPDGSEYRQTAGGFGGEFLVMLAGALRENFVLGGMASVATVPSARIRYDHDLLPSGSGSIFTFTIGPSVDYYPSKLFHVGGMFGYSNEKVPPLAESYSSSTHVSGVTSAIWVGFDWSVATGFGLGVMAKGQLIGAIPRDNQVHDNRINNGDQASEGALSLGIGVTGVYF